MPLSVLLCIVAAPAAQAQVSDETVKLDQTVLVGTTLDKDELHALKTPTPIINVPSSLSFITAEQISMQGFTSVGDIVDYTPGVTTSQGEGHRDAVVFRGVRSTADFFVDGVRDDVQYYRPLYNIEQVEILRGPNALLFGRGGTGGILNRVTKKGIMGEDFTEYQFGVDTFGGFDLQLDSNVTVDENAAVRVNAMYEHLENHRDFFDGDRYGVNPTANIQLGPETILNVSYEYMNHERFVDRGIPTGDNGKPVEAFEDIVFGDPELNTSELEAHVVRAQVQHQFLDNLQGNLNVSYGYYDKMYQNFYASDYDQSNNQVTLDGYLDTTDRKNLVFGSDIIGEFSTGEFTHTILFGAEYSYTSSDQDRYNPVWTTSGNDKEVFIANDPLSLIAGKGVTAANDDTAAPFTQLNDDTRVDLNVYSFYIQDEVQVTDWLQLVLGARFDSFEFKVSDVLNDENRSQTDEEISPRAGVIIKPIENISLYTSYSQSFLPKSGEQYANLSTNNLGVSPDAFTNYEAGMKWDYNQSLRFTSAIFHIEEDATEGDGNGNYFAVESEVSGFEAQLQGLVTHDWFVSMGYTYLDGEIHDASDAAVDGNRPRELPEHMFSVWNRFQVTEKFGLGVGLIYQDESYIAEDNDTTLPSYVRVDAAAYYTISENVRVQLNIENLTDQLYFPNAHADHQVTVGAPIHARLSISGRF